MYVSRVSLLALHGWNLAFPACIKYWIAPWEGIILTIDLDIMLPGPFIGNLKSMSTKKWRGPNDDELKTMVVIPKYLSRDMANAVASEGVATPEGPPVGEKIEAPTCPILVFINSKSGGRLGPELMDHFEELISPEQVRNSWMLLLAFVSCLAIPCFIILFCMKMCFDNSTITAIFQVYDLSKHSPAAVLRYGIGCLDGMADSDECARQTRQNLRILVRLIITISCVFAKKFSSALDVTSL